MRELTDVAAGTERARRRHRAGSRSVRPGAAPPRQCAVRAPAADRLVTRLSGPAVECDLGDRPVEGDARLACARRVDDLTSAATSLMTARRALADVDAVQHAHALELPVDPVDVSANSGASPSTIGRGRGRSTSISSTTLAGARAHHEDPVGEPDRLLHAVRDEEHRGPAAQPQRFQVGAHLQPRQRIERAERLVHQEDATGRAPACGSATRAGACRPTAGADTCASPWSSRNWSKSSLRAVLELLPRQLADVGMQHDVVERGPEVEQQVVLERDADVGDRLGHRLATHHDVAAAALEQARRPSASACSCRSRTGRRPTRTRPAAMSTSISFSARNGWSVSSPNVFRRGRSRSGRRTCSVDAAALMQVVPPPSRRRQPRDAATAASGTFDTSSAFWPCCTTDAVLVHDLDVEGRDRLRRPATGCRATR